MSCPAVSPFSRLPCDVDGEHEAHHAVCPYWGITSWSDATVTPSWTDVNLTEIETASEQETSQ